MDSCEMLTGVLGTKSRSSEATADILNHCTIPLALEAPFSIKIPQRSKLTIRMVRD